MSKEVKVDVLSGLKPGQLKAVTVDGHQLLLANVEGEIYATDEMCTHEEWSLANGALKGDCVECPLHGSRFSLKTGAPLEEPATDALRTYPTRVVGEDIYVTLD